MCVGGAVPSLMMQQHSVALVFLVAFVIGITLSSSGMNLKHSIVSMSGWV